MQQEIRTLLRQVYPTDLVESLAVKIEERVNKCLTSDFHRKARDKTWCESDVLLITYADAFREEGINPLKTLGTFLKTWVPNLMSQVHLLPFFPYTSDDGFSVSDYRAVDPLNGTWSDIEALNEEAELVFDFVINHGSSSHALFQDFLAGRSPGNAFFLTASSDESDIHLVTRPRATQLLQAYETSNGIQHVWCTFSRDQVDWDFSNPDVLYEFIDIFVTYLERGASWLRLDAIAYLWKELGTNCVHLSQTHAIVKLFRIISECISPSIKLLTETNVPLEENLSYFGDGDEAHIVYNFSLPPLLTHALLTEQSSYLTGWLQSLPHLAAGCTYLNFSASHDGIGLRPAEGILDETELGRMVDCIQSFDGKLTQRSNPDGSKSPYEANISLFDAFKGTVNGKDEWQVERFLLSQCLVMSLTGVPAIYYNSLLAAPNNLDGLEKTGRNRTINRKKWILSEIEARFESPNEAPRRVLEGIKSMLTKRKAQPAFHPEAPQTCLNVDPRVFTVIRHAIDDEQVLLCLFNLSRETISIHFNQLNMSQEGMKVVHTQEKVHIESSSITLSPYAALWMDIVS